MGKMISEEALISTFVERLRREEPNWGKLIAAMRFKRELVSHFGVEAAFQIYMDTLKLPLGTVLRRRSISGMIDVAREGSGFFRQLHKGGTAFHAPPMNIIGESDFQHYNGLSRGYYLACFHDCLVRGRSQVILQGDFAIVDAEADELRRVSDTPELDPWILAAETECFWTMEPDASEAILEVEEAFMLSGTWGHEFGHWIIEFLPRIAMASLAGIDLRLPVLIDASTHPNCVQALDLFLPDRTATIRIPHLAPARVGRLWVTPRPLYLGFYPVGPDLASWESCATYAPEFARLLHQLILLGDLDAILPPVAASRIFLARKPTRIKKKMRNHQVIEQLALDVGFHVVYPEDLTFADQISLVRHADHIIGPEGSNMLLPFFAKRGSKVCCLTNPNVFPLADNNSIMKELGIDYTVFTGHFEDQDPEWLFWCDYTISPTDFKDFLESWISAE